MGCILNHLVQPHREEFISHDPFQHPQKPVLPTPQCSQSIQTAIGCLLPGTITPEEMQQDPCLEGKRAAASWVHHLYPLPPKPPGRDFCADRGGGGSREGTDFIACAPPTFAAICEISHLFFSSVCMCKGQNIDFRSGQHIDLCSDPNLFSHLCLSTASRLLSYICVSESSIRTGI